MTAVGETRGELPQIAFADRLAAQRAPSLWTGPPAIHQDEFHMSPPLEAPLPSVMIWSLTRERLNRTEVNAADAVVLAAHTRVGRAPYLRCPAHTLVAIRWAAECVPHAVQNRAGMLGHGLAIDARQVNSQQFRASEVRARSTYSMVGPAPIGEAGCGRKRRICAASSLRSCC